MHNVPSSPFFPSPDHDPMSCKSCEISFLVRELRQEKGTYVPSQDLILPDLRIKSGILIRMINEA